MTKPTENGGDKKAVKNKEHIEVNEAGEDVWG